MTIFDVSSLLSSIEINGFDPLPGDCGGRECQLFDQRNRMNDRALPSAMQMTKQPVFNRIPFRTRGRIMGDQNLDAETVGNPDEIGRDQRMTTMI